MIDNAETSIVIRTFNEEKYLPKLLEAIHHQIYQDFEVIVVDSGSFDNTCEIARHHCDKLVQIDSADFTFGYSLNIGIRNAIGRYVAIVSAHTEPVEPTWLGNLIAPLKEDQVAMVYGRQFGKSNSNFAEVQDFRRTFGSERKILKPPHFFANNANSAIRRDLWEEHSFDETLPGLEDIEWAKYWMERGYQVIYEPEAAIYHIHEESWSQVQRRYYREAVAAKWIEIKGRRHIPLELFKETKNTANDLLKATKAGCLRQKSQEIIPFRFNKIVGTTKGLWDAAVMGDPRRRNAMFFDKSCQAVLINGVGQARVERVPIPPVKPADVLIKVAYEGVCGTDLEILHGTLGYYKTGMAKYPIIPGHEFSGRVVKIGPNVNHLQVGDPIVAECIQSCGECKSCRRGNWIACKERKEVGVIGQNGAYAEYVVLPARFVHKLPDDLDLKKASLCEPLAVVLKGLKRLERAWGPGKKKSCAVVGAGPIGHLCALILSLRGHQVTVFDRHPLRKSYFEGSEIQIGNDLEELSAYEALVEATGDPQALNAILHNSAPGATLLLLGLPYSRQEFNFEGIVAYDKTIVGSVGSSAEDFQAAIEILPQLDLSLFTEQLFPLEEFHQAWTKFNARENLKILLEVDDQLNDV